MTNLPQSDCHTEVTIYHIQSNAPLYNDNCTHSQRSTQMMVDVVRAEFATPINFILTSNSTTEGVYTGYSLTTMSNMAKRILMLQYYVIRQSDKQTHTHRQCNIHHGILL